MILSPHEAAWLALSVGGWTLDEAKTMVAVAIAESGLDTDRMGRSTVGANIGQRDHGLWQISGRWHGDLLQRFRWRDPFDNCRMARAVWDAQGFGAWAVYNSGSYKQWLPDAEFGCAAPFRPVNPATTAWRT